MKLTYDPEADAAYIYLVPTVAKGEVEDTRRCFDKGLDGMISFDFDKHGKLLGVEVLGASRRLRPETLRAAVQDRG